jgi:hypothetical protein
MKKLKLLISIVFLIFNITSIHSQQTGLNEKPLKAVILDSTKANALANIVFEGQIAQKQLDLFTKTKKTQDLFIDKLQENINTFKKAQKISDTIIITNNDVIIKKKDRKITFWQWISTGLASLLIYVAVK